MRQRRRNPIGNVLVMVAACVLFVTLFAHQVAQRAMFFSKPSSYEKSDQIIQIPADADVQLAAFHGEAPGAKYTIFYLHGNAEDMGETMPFLSTYRLNGYSVFSFDYRGYGLTPGQSTEKLAYADAERALDYLVRDLAVPSDRVILHGRSLGAAIAIELATRRNLAGVILEAPFRSVYKLMLPMDWVPGDKFRNEDKIQNVDEPTLFIHGDQDETVPISHGQRLAELLGESKGQTFWIEGGGHNDLPQAAGTAYWRRIAQFADSLGGQ